MEDAENDLTELRIKRSRHRISTREGWASVRQEAKVLKGLWSQYAAKELCHEARKFNGCEIFSLF
jgi:hypothetical protein